MFGGGEALGARPDKPPLKFAPRFAARALTAIVTASAVTSTAVVAADWKITPRLEIRETYTNNVNLAPGGQGQSEWVTEVDPGVSVSARGARLQMQASYAYQQRFYANNSNANGNNHSLTSSGLLDVWNRNLFIQASASIAQANVSPLGAQPASNINITGNRTEVRGVNVSPYWVSRLGSWANLQARYTWSQVESTGATSALNSESQSVNVGLSSGPAFSDFGWSASYNLQYVDSSAGSFSRRELETTTVSARYRIFPTLAITGSTGKEDNSYEGVQGESSSTFWNAGLDWAPSPRTRVAATIGERLFGKTYSLDASHRTRLTTWTLGYSEQIVATPGVFSVPTTVSTAATLDPLFINQFPDPIVRQQFVQALIVATGLPTSLATSVDFLTNQVSLSKRLHGTFGLKGVRSNLVIGVFRDDRVSQSTGATLIGTDPFSLSDKVVQTGYSAALSWRFSERASGTASFSQSRAELTDTGRQDDNYLFGVGVTYRLQPKVQSAVNYRLNERHSNTPGQNSREHSVIGILSMTF